jgi:hypothetical protein
MKVNTNNVDVIPPKTDQGQKFTEILQTKARSRIIAFDESSHKLYLLATWFEQLPQNQQRTKETP